MKTVVQCDFDGTITQEDASFLLLDVFADGDWRRLLREYRERKISVGRFNTEAFAMVKADRQTLLNFVTDKVELRPGVHELIAYCRRKGFLFVIVSNGLDFYIKAILRSIGIEDIDVFAAQTHFSPEGIKVQYIGPEGNQLEDGLKETYVKMFLGKGYRVVYMGDGISDIYPAQLAYHIFARGNLLTSCKEMNLNCTPFVNLNDVVSGLEFLLNNC